MSLLVTEVSAVEFQLYSKNPKTIHTIPRSVEEDIQPAKGVKGGDTPIPSSQLSNNVYFCFKEAELI
jgi:hypothetical protein